MQSYRGLLAQTERIEAFRRAIAAVVNEGDRVLDVGTGLGTFAFFAADAGASRVWAVDEDPILHVARAVAAANGYTDRVEFIRGRLPEVELPALCDVLVFEDFLPRLLSDGVFRLLRDLRTTHTVADVRVVPRRARMMAAPIRSERVSRELLGFGSIENDTLHGIDWSPTRDYAANTPTKSHLASTDLAAEPAMLNEFWFEREPDATGLGGSASWQVTDSCEIQALAYWFDLELAPGEWLSNAPGSPVPSWGLILLPLDPPFAVEAGERLDVEIGPVRLQDGAPGWLTWSAAMGGREIRGSEFAANPASLSDLTTATPDAVPTLDGRGEAELIVLSLTDGVRSTREIAVELENRLPQMSATVAQQTVAAVLRGRVETKAAEAEEV